MIIEKLIKLDEPKRKTVAVLTVLVIACACYFAITRDSITKLKTAKASCIGLQTAYAKTVNQQTELPYLQKQLEEKERQLQEHQKQYFGSKQAVQFFENIYAIALTHNLKPISRVISDPQNLFDDKSDHENTLPKLQFVKIQSAKLAVAGNYFDLVDFMDQLTGGPQKICITNLHITLPAGEKYKPKATFKITLLIDILKDIEK
jgi:Tfp pilus assembly protein PilO